MAFRHEGRPVKWLKIFVVIAACAALWFGRSMFLPAENSPVEPSDSAPTMTRVHALGRLEPRGSILRVGPMSGNEGARVSKLFVEEGQRVKVGQLLCVMDGIERRESAVQEALANLAVAETRLNRTLAGAKKGDIEAAKAAYSQAQQQQKLAARKLKRVTALQENRAASPQQFDDAKWAYERAALDVARLKGTYDALAEVRETDVLLERSMIKASEATLSRAKADLAAANVLAPATGTILKIHARLGEKPQENGVFELGDIEHMQVVAEVYEGDVSKLAVGMPVSFKVESSPRVLSGSVAELGSLVARKIVLTNDPVSDTDARVVEVRIDIEAGDIRYVSRLSNARVSVDFDLSGTDKSNADSELQSALP